MDKQSILSQYILTSVDTSLLFYFYFPQYIFIKLDGSINFSIECLQAVFNKFKSLQQLSIYYQSQSYVGWDLNYHINIQNSMKNYRQSQKWCHAISQSLNNNNEKAKLIKILTYIPSCIISLNLRNTSIGKMDNSIKILL